MKIHVKMEIDDECTSICIKRPAETKKRKVAAIEEKFEGEYDLNYESDAINRYPCYECKTIRTTTRIMNNPDRSIAHYLCYNCAMSEAKYRGWKEITVKYKIQRPAAPIFINEDTKEMIKMYPTAGGYTDLSPEKRC